ncbi:MAG: ATP-binding cassette domain-containing protein [Lachnospiraceae bacterium]|nr:oligopeptide/dipeptide ABC transporter ATP-binding protein [uncultured Acetatifactor sp.]MCI8542254.1 ATP-binding cassette domain-containing protein [Lachnospiraceae bacterium]
MGNSQSENEISPAEKAKLTNGRPSTAASADHGTPPEAGAAAGHAPSREKLLTITNLKKYFPVAKSSLFTRQMYVRANEDISIDIYRGETFGLVGESGCGKSTLGRVLLQLYEQTAGSTMYYGRTLEEVAPGYVMDTLSHAEKYIEKYHKARAHAEELTKKCDELGENATFFDLQSKNLALCDARTALEGCAKILGGFMVRETRKGASLLSDRYRLAFQAAALAAQAEDISLKIDVKEGLLEEIPPEQSEQKGRSIREKIDKLTQKRNALTAQQGKLLQAAAEIDAKIRQLKAPYEKDSEFARYESMLDDGVDLKRLKYNEMRHLRKDLQIIFQDPYSSLNPRMTVGRIIEEGLVTHRFFKAGSRKMQEYVFRVMNSCGLQNYMYNRYPHQFSGGQRQRICIARSLAVKPKFVVCDECVSALDVSIQSQIINLLQELKEREGLTYLFISHNLSVVRYISDRIGVMYLGNMVEVAETDEIFSDPRHPYTIALLSSIPTTDPDSLTRQRIILEGNIPSPIKPPSGCKFHTRCFMACDKCKVAPPPLTEVKPGHYVACHFAEQRKVDEAGNYLFDVSLTTVQR